jgi:hypothetical protein
MKNVKFPVLLLLVMVLSLSAAAQNEQKAPAKVKKGWNFGPLPAIGYNSDLGFQYGALTDIFFPVHKRYRSLSPFLRLEASVERYSHNSGC